LDGHGNGSQCGQELSLDGVADHQLMLKTGINKVTHFMMRLINASVWLHPVLDFLSPMPIPIVNDASITIIV
jgi:hypothetical protein